MSRFRIALGVAAIVASAVGIAVPALAGAAEEPPRAELTPQVRQAPDTQPKFAGDPFEGKCVYWLKGEDHLRECDH
ncbi:hypothetical protein Lesp02_41530 [Lentzea sp. NBRC 105346]|uniref:hypothetical protein n=1 Tax=Lentzea sp. NBRC 105346 TaxID=3032205 RepID=UPI0024A44635|nr:hypothetical protein [Lentzea sp. NBRC 105346]GLZ31965.1 hypothetical protein Lesp02_41530 [Lentzea sp. NBRC 105346]